MSRSRTNHLKVRVSTSGTTAYAISARTTVSGRINRSDNLITNDSVYVAISHYIRTSHVPLRISGQLPGFRAHQRYGVGRLDVPAPSRQPAGLWQNPGSRRRAPRDLQPRGSGTIEDVTAVPPQHQHPRDGRLARQRGLVSDHGLLPAVRAVRP